MNVRELRIADFDYELPDFKIARHPLELRDKCKLLVFNGSKIIDSQFDSLPNILPQNSILVCNNTKVINARLTFRKPTGSSIEIFLLEPHLPADYERSFAATESVDWIALVGGKKRWKSNPLSLEITLENSKKGRLDAHYIEAVQGGAHIVRFTWTPPDTPFADIVTVAGVIPIPPYLNRNSESSDSSDYQTVYSQIKGSVAAPTAGLHFTQNLLDNLAKKGIPKIPVTLHVGAGTFQPVKSDVIEGHDMHTETFSISRDALDSIINALKENKNIIAVGTTSVRTLESLPYIGKAIQSGSLNNFVDQWDPYSPDKSDFNTIDSLLAIRNYMKSNNLDSLVAHTAIMIAPGFNWRIVTDLITNFHQPQSTLLLLVASFLGDSPEMPHQKWKNVYNHALNSNYRFLSYGDACLFHRQK